MFNTNGKAEYLD